jgi:iron complex transport system substrate-binding protein
MNGVLNVVTRKAILLVLIAALTLSFIGCGYEESISENINAEKSVLSGESRYPMIVTDSQSRQVKIDKEPEKVISIAPNITEIIYGLDKANKLVGRTEYCDYPDEAKNITSIGTIEEPNIEKIVELKPDLVIISALSKTEAIRKLEQLGINVLVLLGEESFEGVYETIEKVGMVLNAEKKAESVITEMKLKVQNVLDKVKGKPRPKVYYVVSFGKVGDFTAGRDTFIGQMIEMAGGKNVADDVEGWAYSLEKLVEKKPEIIICSKYYDTKEGIKNAAGYKDLDAVREGKLYEIDNNPLDRQGPRLADGLTELARIIHADAFE